MRIGAGVVAVVCLCVSAFAAEPSRRTLSFEDRVRAQEAIERVYYGHQLGTTKPFEEAVPRKVLEAKVHKYLDETAALQIYWKTSVTDYTLDRELERMAAGTRMPERLQELYAALGNDPILIKECLARATLVDRLAHNFYAFDATLHAGERSKAEELHRQLVSGELSPKSENPNRTVSELVVGEKDDKQPLQQRLSVDEFKDQRAKLPTAVGRVSEIQETRDGFVFNVVLSETPTTMRVANYAIPKVTWDAWWATAKKESPSEPVATVASSHLPLPKLKPGLPIGKVAACVADGRWDNGALSDVPEPRRYHTAVWTGSVMVVWGGVSSGYYASNTGGRYDPATDTWASTSTTGAPAGRFYHSAVWTGTEMVVWGGTQPLPGTNYSSGGRYDPVSDSWTPTSNAGVPSARDSHTAVWTGSVMVVWGGEHYGDRSGWSLLNTGGSYDPSTDSWTATSIVGTPSARTNYTAVWIGRRMIVWGGSTGGYFPVGDGGQYDPATNTWTPMQWTTGRYDHTAVWTGTDMIVWGGQSAVPCSPCDGGYEVEPVNTGARYDPATDQWTAISAVDAPTSLYDQHSAVWTGSLMLVWGGNVYSNAGGRYDPSTDSWTPTSTTAAPSGREASTAVWTGSRMVVWGGYDISIPPSVGGVNTGGRYDPSTDRWTPTSTMGTPSARDSNSAVWTGSLMVDWGGRTVGLGTALDSGGRYDPATDSWSATSAVGAPQARLSHSAVWTGSEMLVWGGFSNANSNSEYLDTGGRYDPMMDAWTPMSATDAPSPRASHTAVWSGSSMIVWGGATGFYPNTVYLNSGARYDPSTDSWTSTSTTDAPTPRGGHTSVWTGTVMVVWGGQTPQQFFDTGGRYDPSTDRWTPTSTTGAPTGRAQHSAVWLGSRMIVWGGNESGGGGIASGGRYDPDADTWAATSMTAAPAARTGHAAVSTGSLMLVWGGASNSSFNTTNTGAWYNPTTDRWTKITTTGQPFLRSGHTAIWTGDAMIVWGGGYANGGRYFLGTSLDDDCDGDGVSSTAGDCDDHNASTYPGAPQICDGTNNDCNASLWPRTFDELDLDGDGFLTCAGDCDDYNSAVYPGAPQSCDGVNNDCTDSAWPTVPADEADADGDGFRVCQHDCDDTRGWVYPGAYEYCDGRDEDCDGIIDNLGDAACIDNNPCTDDSCGGVAGCLHTYNSKACDDDNPCTSGDVCTNGYCYGAPADGAPCDDHNVCTLKDACLDRWCQSQTRLVCDDGRFCNGIESCQDFVGCVAGPPVFCDDYNECTDDRCDDAVGCVHTNNTSPCDDSNACTVGDTCQGGTCRGGPPPACGDNNVCNGVEYCDPYYGCVHPQAPDCNDLNPCTADWCDPITGCVHANVSGACDDGSVCTSVDRCVDGVCRGTAPIVCNDGNPCTVDSCDPWMGCVYSSYPDPCDDHNYCTDDSCDPSVGCIHANNNYDCDDRNVCTAYDTCSGGFCQGTTIVCDDLNPCTTDTCDPVTGCVVTNNTNPCDDGNACTTNDQCGARAVPVFLAEDFDGVDAPGLPIGWMSAATGAGIPWTTDNTGSASAPNSVFGLDAAHIADEVLLTPEIAITSTTARLTFQNRWSFEDELTCWDAGVLEIRIGSGDFVDIVAAGGTFVSGGYTGYVEGYSGNPIAYRSAWCFQSPSYPDYLTTEVALPASVAGQIIQLRWRVASDAGGWAIGQNIDSIVISDSTNTCNGGAPPDCDDGNPCTNDSCAPTTGCVHFDDPARCDDGNPCTDDACNPAGGCFHNANTNACNDGNACTSGDICGGGACHSGTPLNCNDGNACNGVESCNPATGCVGGTPLACNDNNPCTNDGCNPATGCVYNNNANACDDGSVCTYGDACAGGSCHGTAIACNDNNVCTTDTCNPVTGCVFTNNTNACDDGNACTTGDTCGPPPRLFAENFDGLTAPALPGGWTSAITGTGSPWMTRNLSSESAPNSAFGIDNGQTADEVLDTPEIPIPSASAQLTFRNRWSFDDSANCFDAAVLEIKIGAGSFADIVTAGGSFASGGYTGIVSADYGNPLAGRPAWCNASTGYPAYLTTAVNLPAAAAGQTIKLRWRIGSDSSAAVTGQDIDSIVVTDPTRMCHGGPPTNCDDNNPCTDDSCNPTTGCVHTANTSACNDGNACTSGDTCGGGACHGPALVCNDNNACTTDSCNPATGCVFTNNSNACNDGNACTTGDICGGGSCHPGAPVVCTDNNACTTDACNPATGCVFTNNSNPCNDGNACTAGDVCSNGACVGSIPVTCAASDQCHDAGTCNPATGVCSNPVKPNGATCDDGSTCTTGETCQNGACRSTSDGHHRPRPRSSGYYERLCDHPQWWGDHLSDADAVCVGQMTTTFRGISDVDAICDVLDPDFHGHNHSHRHCGHYDDHPSNSQCDKAEKELMALALNLCRGRVCQEQGIDSHCGANTNTTVAQSFAQVDAMLADSHRNQNTCRDAKCLAKEINNGYALELDSLSIARQGTAIRLNWLPPELDDGTGDASSYTIQRRVFGSGTEFAPIGTTTGLTFLDTTAGSGAFEYEVTVVVE